MSSISSEPVLESARQGRLVGMLREGFAELSGVAAGQVDPRTPFFEMGADSLFLLRASNGIQDRFGVKVPFRMMFEEVSTIEALAAYIDQNLPADKAFTDEPETAAAAVPVVTATPAPTVAPPRQEPVVVVAAPVSTSPVPVAPLPAPYVAESGQPANETTRQVAASVLDQILAQQLQIMSKQLDVLRGLQASRAAQPATQTPPAEPITPTPQQTTTPQAAQTVAKANGNGNGNGNGHAHAAKPATATLEDKPSAAVAASSSPAASMSSFVAPPTSTTTQSSEAARLVPYQAFKIEKGSAWGLSERQQEHLQGLIARVTERTRGSRDRAQAARPVLADNRATAGFHPLWKEMQYPLLTERGVGSRLWDVDGNEYVDLTMGFGALLFGHSPPFLVEALQTQIGRGIQLGASSPLAGEVAALIAEMTGVERVAFCNSGTEAVMSALRLARTVTGRDKVAMFEGCYHGTFDGVMVRPERAEDGSVRPGPAARGVPQHMVDNVLILKLDEHESIAKLRAHAHELAAILIEPIPNRAPQLQLKPYLTQLREIADESGAALIFDEVVTGFRFHPGGAQGLFGIRPDLVTYGKALGGGIPIGVVAGKAAFMDTIDGGAWNYGDRSYPRAETTFYAGTFFKHPLVMPALWAVLKHMKEHGPQLQERLNERTARLVAELNDFFKQHKFPVQTASRASLFRFFFSREIRFADIFYYHLLEKGVYISETRGCFLSTSHTEEDIAYVVRAVKETLTEMRRGGFIPEPPDGNANGGPNGRGAAGAGNGANGKPDVSAPTAAAADAGGASAAAAGSAGASVPTSNSFAAETSVAVQTEITTAPLTEAQRDLWALAQLGEDASSAYNESVTLRLGGSFNVEAMRKALAGVVARHDALRTTFSPDGSCQRIAAQLEVDLPLADFAHVEAVEREARAAAWLAAEARQPFDLARGPLIRARVARLAADEHLLVLTMHHLITDGRSNGILFREIAALYTAACNGTSVRLPARSQFSGYARRQAEAKQTDEAAEKYWLAQLASAPTQLELPTDRPRPAVRTFAGAHERAPLAAPLGDALRRLSQQQGSTLFMTLLAGFNVLLHRLSGQDDLVVGFSSAGQPTEGDADFVGYTVNLLPVRSRVSGEPSFNAYLKTVKRTVLDAFEHQHYPFSRLLKKLNLTGDVSRPPLISAVFNLDRLGGRPRFAGLDVEVSAGPSDSAKFDIFLNVTELEGAFILDWEYNTDLYDAATIRRWAAHYETLLESAVATPDLCLLDLPVMTKAERFKLLVDWNGDEPRASASACLHRLFEAQAASAPDRIALVCENAQVSYGELNRRADKLAARLRALGVAPETLVGMCLEPSPEMVVGILGILKAGGAYVPFDPRYPAARLEYMIADSRVPVLLTQTSLRAQLPACAAQVICVDDDTAATADANDAACHVTAATPENVAYVVYTSGSTGRPKGVLVTHHNVARIFEATQAQYAFDENDTWSLFHSYAFDFSVWEFWGALLHGGRLVIAPHWVRRAPEAFHDFLCQQQVSVLNQTPSAFRQFVAWEQGAKPARVPPLRLVIFGGEALDLQGLKPWFDRHGDETPRLVNMYGISETTIHVTLRELRASDLRRAWQSVIGGPVSDLQIYLLDGRAQPTPLGVAGEIHVGGAGLARGYLGRPELTAERFVPNPFSHASGTRLYKSGDVARFLEEGDVEFLGRADHQVKVRGYRIEPGEIEAALGEHPAVAEVVVMARDATGGEKRLVAYVVGAQGATVAASELRGFLQAKLPPHMIPAVFVVLDALPLTEHGKVDRRALPEPGQERPDVRANFAAPLTTVERGLANIWAQVLGVGSVGVHDNFFELGGDSILAIQVTAKANEAGLRVTPKQIFQLQTVAELAAVVDTTPTAHAEQGAVTGPVPLTPIQQWFFDSNPFEPHHFNQAVMLEVPAAQDPSLWERIIGYVLAHHDALRLRFEQTPAGWRQHLAAVEQNVPFTRLDFSALPREARAEAIRREAARVQVSLDLAAGPIMRAIFFDLGPAEAGRLLIVINHLAVDAVSWRILIADVQTAYRQLTSGAEIKLPPKTTSVKYWAERLTEHARSAAVRAELDYWIAEARKGGSPLPLDFPGGANTVESTRRASHSLTEEETRALLHDVPKAYHTQISDVMLTALAQTFAAWTGARALTVGLEGHGRETLFDDVDLSRTVGWFTSLYPVSVELRADEGPGASLKRVKEQLRRIPQGGIGFGLLRHLANDPQLRQALVGLPEPEVIFNYLGQFKQPSGRAGAEQRSAPAVRMAREGTGPTRSPRADRGHLIEVGGSIVGGRLTMHWSYSVNLHTSATIERLARQFAEHLRALIAHCQAPEAGGYTPSDFPHMNFSQNELDELLDEIKEEDAQQ